MASLKCSDVFKSLNIAFGSGDTQYVPAKEVSFKDSHPVVVPDNIEDICGSYSDFCNDLLTDTFPSKGFKEDFNIEDSLIEDFIEDKNSNNNHDDDSVIMENLNTTNANATYNIIESTPTTTNFETNKEVEEESFTQVKQQLRGIDERLVRDKSKHPLLPPCECKAQCIEHIDEILRKTIHDNFWKNSYNERICFIKSKTTRTDVKRRKG